MASISRLKTYAEIEAGKRLVSVPVADLPAVKVWLWEHGFRWKTNKNGKVANILIEERK